jgi:hypothetical protein
MPFIVQCPHTDCSKYMMLEDHTRGTTVDCLLCKRPIKVDASSHGSHPGSAAVLQSGSNPQAGKPSAPKPAEQAKVVSCPNPQCKTPLKLPAPLPAAIRCPKCKQVFKP